MADECNPAPPDLTPEELLTLADLSRALQGRATDTPTAQQVLRQLQHLAPLLARMPDDWRGTVHLEYQHSALVKVHRSIPAASW
jgi:hypothetical protein